jgi:hypothetical protein
MTDTGQKIDGETVYLDARGRFRVEIGGVRIEASSLPALRKAVAKAQADADAKIEYEPLKVIEAGMHSVRVEEIVGVERTRNRTFQLYAYQVQSDGQRVRTSNTPGSWYPFSGETLKRAQELRDAMAEAQDAYSDYLASLPRVDAEYYFAHRKPVQRESGAEEADA